MKFEYANRGESAGEEPALPETSLRVAYTIVELAGRGELINSPDFGDFQINGESRDKAGEVVPITLFGYVYNEKDIICRAEVATDFGPEAYKLTEFWFFSREERVMAEKHVRLAKLTEREDDDSEERSIKKLTRNAMTEEEVEEDREMVRDMGLDSVAEAELLDLEQLILRTKFFE